VSAREQCIDGQRGALAISTARLLEKRERAGEARQTGHTLEFEDRQPRGAAAENLVLVRSWTWTSKPMTARTCEQFGGMADSVANFVMVEEKV